MAVALLAIAASGSAALSGCEMVTISKLAATQTGIASYYSNDFQGRKTSSGEIFDNSKLTAAHRTYPFGTLVKVTNLATDANVEVRINDRGPVKTERIIDLSLAAAKAIGIDRAGLAKVRIEVLEWGKASDRPKAKSSSS